MCRISYATITIKRENTIRVRSKIIQLIASLGFSVKNTETKVKPVNNSTKKYWGESFDLHPWHRPPCITKLTRGISSKKPKDLPQEKHIDLPFVKERPVLKRTITTLRKLPTMRPRQKNQIKKIHSILAPYFIKSRRRKTGRSNHTTWICTMIFEVCRSL